MKPFKTSDGVLINPLTWTAAYVVESEPKSFYFTVSHCVDDLTSIFYNTRESAQEELKRFEDHFRYRSDIDNFKDKSDIRNFVDEGSGQL